ncbi:hypothetical protein Lfu02_51430 [Longispora fulva]|uniref:Uncharacterized protein n=1 Tax=Longispora fulva TaxID=619741 RepID=A0A8J7GPL7_9ACTN|nr:hypothetical protein [Longispora fulva]MBG6140963.1 hypothetical protein [Longispora fulva]GIG60771.1 hypothetical protein Lfu02_51430 [Longispora fulva]
MNMPRLVLVGAGAALALLIASPASAAPGVQAPSSADLAAARQATSASLTEVGRFFASAGRSPVGVAPADLAAKASAAAPQVVGDSVAVYSLNPAFVRSADAAVAVADLIATKTVASDGRTASVWTAKQSGAWTVVNIAEGAEEVDYAVAGAGGTVFKEPQINAWYVLRGDRVTPLNADARGSVGDGVSVAAYQKLVHKRYADKLPGSAYDKAGKAGGYGESAGDGSPTWPWLVALAALGLVVFAPRLRRNQ